MVQGNPAPLRRLGDLENPERLGSGGFGTVSKARDMCLGGRIMALKVLDADFAAGPVSARRFHREVSVAANLAHLNIPVIHRFGKVNSRHYIAMQFAPGPTLATTSPDAGPKTVDQMVALLGRVRKFSTSAWTGGLVHRDLKSAKTLVEPGGRVFVTGFGPARPAWSRYDSVRAGHPGLPVRGDASGGTGPISGGERTSGSASETSG